MSALQGDGGRAASARPGIARSVGRRLAHDFVGARGLAAATPAPVWLALVVVGSFFVQLSFGRHMAAPWIFGDELIYSEFAKSFAASGHFAIREVPTGGLGPLYPILISPAWALYDSVPTAYAAAKAINALLFALTALPAYVLARRVLRPGSSLVVAALTVAVPSAIYTGSIMTESAFYPAFVAAAAAMVLALERPTAARQLLVLGSIGVAFLIRAQAVVLAPAFVTTIVVFALLETRASGGRGGDFLRALRAFSVTWAAGLVSLAAIVVVRGGSPTDVVGSYGWAVGNVSLTAIPHWFLLDLADLDLYLGIVPFAAFPVVLALAFRRGESRALRAAAAASVSLVFWMTLVVAGFASQPVGGRIHERNLFYVAPLFLMLFLVWVERGLPRPRAAALLGAGTAAALPALLPFADLSAGPRRLEVLPALPWWNDILAAGSIPVAVTVFAGLLAACFLILPRHLRFVAPALVFLTLYVVGVAARAQVELASRTASAAGASLAPDWIDRRVGPDADVAVVWWQDVPHQQMWRHEFVARRRAVWENEFFNRSVGRVYYYGQRTGFNLPDTRVTVDAGTGTLRADGAPIDAAYALALRPLRLAGRPIAADPRSGMVLYDLRGQPLRIARAD